MTFKNIIRTHHVTALLSFWCGECAWVGKKLAAKYKTRHYCWLLGQDAKKDNKYPHRIKPGSEELIALSDFLHDEFEKNHGTRPQYIIPAAIDPGQFSDAIPEKDILILAAGSLIPLKRYDLFLEIIDNIKKKMPGIKAVLAGAGPEKEKLQSIIATKGLEENVTLAGELPHDQLLKLMERTKVFLHPSSYEGFSGVCLEALYAAAKVISFVKPMHKDIDQWYVVQTPEEMAAKAVALLNETNQKTERVMVYHIDEIAAQFADLLV